MARGGGAGRLCSGASDIGGTNEWWRWVACMDGDGGELRGAEERCVGVGSLRDCGAVG